MVGGIVVRECDCGGDSRGIVAGESLQVRKSSGVAVGMRLRGVIGPKAYDASLFKSSTQLADAPAIIYQRPR